MSEPSDDLMDKADALLSRYRNTAPSDVPVLTEVVELPEAAELTGAPLHSQPLRGEPFRGEPAGGESRGEFPDAPPLLGDAVEVLGGDTVIGELRAAPESPPPSPLPPDWLEPELAAWEQRLRDRLLAVGLEFRARVEDVIEDEVRAFRAEVIERLRSRLP